MNSEECESVLREAVRNSVVCKAKEKMDKSNKADRLIVPHKMTSGQEACLIDTFPELDLVFKHNLFHPHAFAAASRLIEEQINYLALGIDFRVSTPEGFDVLVKDSGGDHYKQILRGRSYVHSCCPILSPQDQLRQANRENSIAKLVPTSRRQRVALRLLSEDRKLGTNVFSCNEKSEDCRVKAPYMLFLHSTYDRTTNDIANAMTSAGASEAAGSFIFDPEMLVRNDGVIKPLGAHYKNFLGEDKYKYITMTFVGDSSWGYTHRLSTYLALMTHPVIFDSKNQPYFVEIKSIRNSLVFFKIVKCFTW